MNNKNQWRKRGCAESLKQGFDNRPPIPYGYEEWWADRPELPQPYRPRMKHETLTVAAIKKVRDEIEPYIKKPTQ